MLLMRVLRVGSHHGVSLVSIGHALSLVGHSYLSVLISAVDHAENALSTALVNVPEG